MATINATLRSNEDLIVVLHPDGAWKGNPTLTGALPRAFPPGDPDELNPLAQPVQIPQLPFTFSIALDVAPEGEVRFINDIVVVNPAPTENLGTEVRAIPKA